MMEKSTMKIKTKWVSSTSPSKVATQMNFVDQIEVLKQCTSEPTGQQSYFTKGGQDMYVLDNVLQSQIQVIFIIQKDNDMKGNHKNLISYILACKYKGS